MDIVARFAGRVVAFYDGGIIGDGPPEAVLRMADVRRYVIGEEAPCCGLTASRWRSAR